MEHSEALDAQIREKAHKLEEFYPNIMRCQVMVEEQQRHKQQGKLFNIRVHLTLPGGEIAVNRDRDEDVYVALRDAFDATKRKLEDFARKQRREVKAHDIPQHGTVTRLFDEEGYGFIETADGRELYFSSDNVVTPSFDQLKVGAEVQFLEEAGAEGPQAKRVTVGKHHVP
jgi:ribosomal subunit interface protein